MNPRYAIHRSLDALSPDLSPEASTEAPDYFGAIRAALRRGSAASGALGGIAAARAPFQAVWDRTDRRVVAVVIYGQLFEDTGDQTIYEEDPMPPSLSHPRPSALDRARSAPRPTEGSRWRCPATGESATVLRVVRQAGDDVVRLDTGDWWSALYFADQWEPIP